LRHHASCHEDDEQDMGEYIAEGGPLEPDPIDGKNGFIELSVQAAHDGANLYMRFEWETQSDGPARVAMMLDDGKVPNFAGQGCWLTCHNGMADTLDQASEAQVKAHPLFGDGGLKMKDVRKYLPASRGDEMASWDKTKSAAEIAKARDGGGFVDLVYWRLKDGKPMTKDGYVLDTRHGDAKGSIDDAGQSSGEIADGVYSVVIQRKLDTGNGKDDKILKVGGVYNVGFAIHDGEVKGRFHHTGFPMSLGIGKETQIEAVAVK
jgi:hypothetical protein